MHKTPTHSLQMELIRAYNPSADYQKLTELQTQLTQFVSQQNKNIATPVWEKQELIDEAFEKWLTEGLF